MTIAVVDYVRTNDSSPFRDWFDSLHTAAATKVAAAVSRLETGHTSSVKWFEGIGEYRIDWGPGYRIYLAKDGDSLILLLGGGTKRRQQTDIDRAKAMWAEYKMRKTVALRSKSAR